VPVNSALHALLAHSELPANSGMDALSTTPVHNAVHRHSALSALLAQSALPVNSGLHAHTLHSLHMEHCMCKLH